LKNGDTKDCTGSSPFIYEDATSETFSSCPPLKRSSKCASKYKIACNGSFECEVETDITTFTPAFYYAETGCGGR
jgi:hypothetical protein